MAATHWTFVSLSPGLSRTAARAGRQFAVNAICAIKLARRRLTAGGDARGGTERAARRRTRASLDIGYRIDLIRRLRAWAPRSIVVLILHDIERAALDCDRLLLLEQGHIGCDSAAAAVARSPDLDRVFGLRFERGSLSQSADAFLTLERQS